VALREFRGVEIGQSNFYATQFLQCVGFVVHVKVHVDISVGWSFAIAFGAASSILEIKEKLMNNLTAIVFVGAALLPVPGWHKLHLHRDRR
jgi:hypothetical protein